MLEKELKAYKEKIEHWQQNQDKHLDDLDSDVDSIYKKIDEINTKLNTIQTKQEVNTHLTQEHKKQNDDFKRQIQENNQNNKNLWIPIIFTSSLTVLGMIIQFFV